jgi:hypothetical protein
MIAWAARSPEERGLLTPSFCAQLLWHSARGYINNSNAALRFELSFLILPMVLHRETRESLPGGIATSLPVWLDRNSLARSRIADRARLLVPFTKEALLFGGLHGLLLISGGMITPSLNWRRRVAATLSDSSDEVRNCARRAEFLGRWFAKSGSPDTVMMLLGVRP